MITMFNNEKQIAKIEKSLKYDEVKYHNSKEYRDYIISTILEKEIVEEINNLYIKYEEWTIETQKELELIISKMKKSKVIIERNKKRAEKLRKKLMNYFVFYK